ncbi:alpha/beta hydrolase [Streptococcus tangpeifui]|uniref:alpha/beta hydrolase n=1 Tax=Streptococcus tangpeifui TaxID=2709400 RepID=UPI0013EC47AB|nr:alpha/beta hydrolase family protein [Streptococcus sp. ZJ373]
MAFFQIEYHSKVLGFERQVNVIYPDSFELTQEEADSKDVPVLYLLHGMGGNQNSWQKRTHIERLLRHTNLIVVMPSTDLAWYTNTAYGLKYFDAIAKELPQVMHRFFPNMTTKREKTYIAGLSMGGYGAYKMALLTNQFGYAGSFSGALSLDMDSLQNDVDENLDYWQGIFGHLSAVDIDRHYLTNMVASHDMKTKFYAWCGQEDFLYQANEKAVADFKKLGLDITYSTAPGRHEWYYWEKQLEAFLRWLPLDYHEEERLS